MTGRKKKAFTIVIVALALGVSACGKDTSVVDEIAGQQYGTAAQNPANGEGNPNSLEGVTGGSEDIAGGTAAEGTGNIAGNTAAEGTGSTAGNTEAGKEENIAGGKEAGGNGFQLPQDVGAEAGTGKDTAADGKNKNGNVQTGEDKGSSDIDVDLTKLSSNMVYAEVYDMMTSPEDYVGKTIKIEGVYYASYWEDTGKYYHCVMISDAAACCQNGIEFVWDDDTHVYPDEYPPDNTVIELTGVFELYEEEGQTYCHIKTDDIIIP